MSANKVVGIIGLVIVLCAWAYIALSGEPRLQVGVANGAYANQCCGTIVLKDGLMTVANQRISYVIEEDKAGSYVLPKTYVGASATDFVIRPHTYALKLRLDNPTHPRQLELLDDVANGEDYLFIRTNAG